MELKHKGRERGKRALFETYRGLNVTPAILKSHPCKRKNIV